MPSDLGRGFKFGVGFALGIGFIMSLFLFGISMCAGRLHRRALEQMQEMLPKERTPAPETPDDPLQSRSYPSDLLSLLNSRSEDAHDDGKQGVTPRRQRGKDAVFLRD
jgi:hypothetical protein